MSQRRTPRSTPKLSETVRHLCVPDGIVTTGWGPVRAQAAELGIQFDRWQDGLGTLILGKRADGTYAAGVGGVVLSIPRQTGKTFTIGWMVFCLCVLFPRLTVIWTAHRTRTATETFQAMRSMARKPRVMPLVAAVRAANGEQAVLFRNGSRILFGARESGFGRGFAQVDLLVLDEAQILSEDAMSDMVPATNAASNGLVIMMGTPPRPKDPGMVFTQRRQDALAGDRGTLYVEFSADPDADLDDWAQVAKANPSFPHRTSKTAVLRMRKLLGADASYRREALGIWDAVAVRRAIPATVWEDSAVEVGPTGGVRSFGVAFNADGDAQAIAGVVKNGDHYHAEVIGAYTGTTESGIGTLADWLADRWKQTARIAIVGPAGSGVLADALRARKVPDRLVQVMTTRQYTDSCAALLEGLRDGTVTHPVGQSSDVLEAAVRVCDKRPRGRDGAWSWTATSPDGDETPLEAVSAALWAARTAKRVPGRRTGGMS
ncbi:terminase family protein [Actinobaculum sp. 352]|uniref:terminase large subunit domain-containing protein n=1 Tax=Actinobaculum sp. 352 TaxID=2490946 RepID=UPI000F7EC17E|nr:terminase family protein [Actinobaculum sp. 352]RTE49628.1 terminase [Actinobaculum sp. 352]